MSNVEIKQNFTGQEGSMPSPHTRISQQIKSLDEALRTINGGFEESEKTRIYIAAQVEALNWAVKVIFGEK